MQAVAATLLIHYMRTAERSLRLVVQWRRASNLENIRVAQIVV
jgi:hypothetical protein